jgi:hypothetical protein
MSELTVDQLVSSLKEIESKQDALEVLGEEITSLLLKSDQTLQLLLKSPTVSAEDKDRAQEAAAEFISNTMKKSVKRLFRSRQQAAAQETIDAAGPGGFPRLA